MMDKEILQNGNAERSQVAPPPDDQEAVQEMELKGFYPGSLARPCGFSRHVPMLCRRREHDLLPNKVERSRKIEPTHPPLLNERLQSL